MTHLSKVSIISVQGFYDSSKNCVEKEMAVITTNKHSVKLTMSLVCQFLKHVLDTTCESCCGVILRYTARPDPAGLPGQLLVWVMRTDGLSTIGAASELAGRGGTEHNTAQSPGESGANMQTYRFVLVGQPVMSNLVPVTIYSNHHHKKFGNHKRFSLFTYTLHSTDSFWYHNVQYLPGEKLAGENGVTGLRPTPVRRFAVLASGVTCRFFEPWQSSACYHLNHGERKCHLHVASGLHLVTAVQHRNQDSGTQPAQTLFDGVATPV